MKRPRHTASGLGLIAIGLVAIGSVATGSAIWPGGAHAAAYTGTGGGPETTFNAPHRSAVGQTVPPGRAAAPAGNADERTQRQQSLDRVLDSICEGC